MLGGEVDLSLPGAVAAVSQPAGGFAVRIDRSRVRRRGL